MTIIKNYFHGTEYRTRKTREEIDRILDTHPHNRKPSEKQWVRKVWNQLCGINGCTCGNDIGERYR